MTTLDFVLAGVLAFGAWRGFRTGALSQVVNTFGVFFAFVAGTAVMSPVGRLVAAGLGVSDRLGPVLGFVAAFGAVLIAVSAAAFVARKALETVKLGAVNRAAGALAGGLRAALLLSVGLLVTGFAPIPGGGPVLVGEETRERSVLYPPVEAFAPEVWGAVRAVTPGLQDALADKFSTWEERRATRGGGDPMLDDEGAAGDAD